MDAESPAAKPRRPRWRPRFSLLSLVLFVLLTGSAYGLWWRWKPWVLEHVLAGHSDAVVCASFSPDGRRIVTASYDKTARTWDAETGRELAVLKGHERNVDLAIFSPDASIVIAAV